MQLLLQNKLETDTQVRGGGGLEVAHPFHAIAVADLQLLLGPLEAAVLLVVGRGLEVDVDVVGGLGSRRHGCKSKHTN